MIERVVLPTRIAGLDTILSGGLIANSLVLLVGSPGAGKTVLASQVLFQAAQSGARGLIITNESEGTSKLLTHLASLAFFDPSRIGSQITLMPFSGLLDANPEGLQSTLTATIRQLAVQWVLVDGFQGAAELLGDRNAVRRFLGALSTVSSYLTVTCLVTLEAHGRDPRIAPELTIADTVLSLDYGTDGWEHVRRIEVIKHRGSEHLNGLHTYTISNHGFALVPRLESLPPPPTTKRPKAEGHARFGLPELDNLIDGGLTTGTATVLAGAPGTGKTTLALHWALADAQPTHPTIFVSFSEDEEQLQRKARSFGLDLDAARTAGSVIVHSIAAADLNPDIVTADVLAAISTRGQRVVFDGIAVLVAALGPRARVHLRALATHLASHSATSFFTLEIQPFVGFRLNMGYEPIQPIADNLMVVQYTVAQGTLHYMLAVLKTRYSPYDPTLRELLLTPGGIKVLRPQDTAPGVFRSIEEGGGGIAPGDTYPV